MSKRTLAIGWIAISLVWITLDILTGDYIQAFVWGSLVLNFVGDLGSVGGLENGQ